MDAWPSGSIPHRGILVGLWLLAAFPLWGQTPEIDELERRLRSAEADVQSIETTLSPQAGVEEIDQARARLVELRSELDVVGSDARTAAEVPRSRLRSIGKPPAKDEPAEPDNIAKLRSTLDDSLRRLEGVSQGATVASADVGRALERAEDLRDRQKLNTLLERRPEVATVQFWREAVADAREVLARVTRYIVAWAERGISGRRWFLSLALGALLLVLARLGPYQLTSKLRSLPSPSREERLVVLAANVLRSTLVAGLLGFLLYDAARATGLVAEAAVPFARMAWLGLTVATFAARFARGYFSPRNATWRGSRGPGARARCSLFIAMTSLVIVDRLLQTALEPMASSIRPELALACLTALLGGVLLFVYARVASQPVESGEPYPPRLAKTYRSIAVLVLTALLLGYVRAALFLFQRLTLIVLFLILVLLTRTLTRWALLPRQPVGNETKADTASVPARSLTFYWMGLALDVGLTALSVPLFLLVVGFDWLRIQAWLERITGGITVGNVTLSFGTVLGAVAAFLLVIAFTRVISNWIDSAVLEHTKLDPGSRQSILTLASYAGFVVALMTSLGIVGVDMTSLAVVAGALSVGIGFGLQSIVNNFVSGIILLFERPIRPGDWVVVPSGEGIVVRTTVRSTEIRTFDRATIIVPNSELISSAVTNWNIGGKVGRTIIKVGVSYGSDPEKVKEVLLGCAAKHAQIQEHPAPVVLWQNFGESSLDFELRAFVGSVNDLLTVTSELRFAIFDAFKKSGIEIPFPQRDLHIIRDDDEDVDSQESRSTRADSAGAETP